MGVLAGCHFLSIGKPVPVGVGVGVTGTKGLFLGVGQPVVVIVLVRVVDGLNRKILVEGGVFVVHDPDVDRVVAHLESGGAKEVHARDREEVLVGRSVSIEEAEKLGIKFSNSGPQKFKNEKKKKNVELFDDNRYYFDDPNVDESSENVRKVTDSSYDKGDKKNLREIINMEK